MNSRSRNARSWVRKSRPIIFFTFLLAIAARNAGLLALPNSEKEFDLLFTTIIAGLVLGVIAFGLVYVLGLLFASEDVTHSSGQIDRSTLTEVPQSESVTPNRVAEAESAIVANQTEPESVSNKSQNVRKEAKTTEPARGGAEEMVSEMSDPKDTRASLMSAYPKAKLAVEYSREATAAWERVVSLPVEHQEMFLKELNSDPKGDARKIADDIFENHRKSVEPFDKPELNQALSKAREIGESAGKEFIEIVETLGDDIDTTDVLSRLEEKFGKDFKPGIYRSVSGIEIRVRPDYGVTVIAAPGFTEARDYSESYADFSSFWVEYGPSLRKTSNLYRVD